MKKLLLFALLGSLLLPIQSFSQKRKVKESSEKKQPEWVNGLVKDYIIVVSSYIKCFKRETLEALDLNNIISAGYSFQIELNYKVYCKGLKIKEVPIIFTERKEGISKMSGNIIFEAIFAIIRLRFRKFMDTL